MSDTAFDPHDIRAALCKRHRTMRAFAMSRGLKPQQVADWLRGRTSAHVANAIADELGIPEVHLALESMSMDDSGASPEAHRLIAAAH